MCRASRFGPGRCSPSGSLFSERGDRLGGYALTGGHHPRRTSVAFVGATGALMTLAARGRREALMLIPIVAAVDLGYWGYSYLWQDRPATLAGLREPRMCRLDGRVSALRAGDVELAGAGRISCVERLRGARPVACSRARFRHRAAGGGRRVAEDAREWQRVDARCHGPASSTTPAPPPTRVGISSVWTSRPSPWSPRRWRCGRAGDAELSAIRAAADSRGGLDGRGLLATTQRHHEGWKARTDAGASLFVVRVNGDYVGVVVEAGRSTVALTSSPPACVVAGGCWVYRRCCWFLSQLFPS